MRYPVRVAVFAATLTCFGASIIALLWLVLEQAPARHAALSAATCAGLLALVIVQAPSLPLDGGRA